MGRAFAYRVEYDAIVDRLIAAAKQDPRLDERDDVLALMLQSKYDDGTGMNRDEIADQLLTLLTAGHETTATTLAWIIERLRRHPAILQRLVDEADAGESRLREATILEVQRVRPVIDKTARQVHAPSMRLGQWTLPRGQVILVSIYLMHYNEALFPDARRFNPECHIPAKVVAVHGITDADVMGAPLFKTAAPLLGNMLQKVNVLIAHNGIEFDAPMIMHEFLRAGVIVTPFPAVFDTMKDGRWATPDGKYPTLGELCWSLDVPYGPALARGALYDVRVMLSCYRRAVSLGLWQLPELASNAA